MCGIAGIYDLGGNAVDPARLGPMVDAIEHRGPDACGYWNEGRVALGHGRLSIIDLSGGAQPMSNPAGNLHITFNGEIFNYLELREDLIRLGHCFESQSDTEVILHLYEEHGERCTEYLNGQWAFAIWDSRGEKLFLSRDRMGIRPLFYAQAGKTLLFGSEMKALFAHPALDPQLDMKALDEVMTFWCSVAPRTAFKGVEQLPPGHSMRVEKGRIDIWPYWELEYSGAEGGWSDEDAIERLRELLIDAVQLRLRSDVPVGAYLSGGLDSSCIVALITHYTNNPLETFSVGFNDPQFDETAFQLEVSRHLDSRHRSIKVSQSRIGELFPKVVWHAEAPLIRTAPAPLYALSRLVRESGYKVVLTGEGADEVLGGYDIFKEAKIRRFWSQVPDSNMRPLLLKRLYPYLKNIQDQPDAYRRAFFHIKPENLGSPFFSHIPRWELTSGIKRFYSKEVKQELANFDVYADVRARLPKEYERWDPFEQAQYLESKILMPGYILSSQGDRMLMGNSVEGRFPFLDHRVVEFAAGLQPSQKMRVLDEKNILKRSFGDLIPESVRNRPKQPYRAPDAVSLLGDTEGKGRPDYSDEMLSSAKIAEIGVFNPIAVEKLVAKFKQGRAIGVRDNMALVGILSTQLLADQFIHSSTYSTPEFGAEQE